MNKYDIEDFSLCINCETKECGLIDGQECDKLNYFHNLVQAIRNAEDKKYMQEIINARITSVSLGYEDHGILTFGLGLDLAGGMFTTFGGYGLDTYNKTTKKRECHAYSMQLIVEIMKTVGVEKWEDLKDKYIRVVKEGLNTPIRKIGNLMEDKWFDVKEFFEYYDMHQEDGDY